MNAHPLPQQTQAGGSEWVRLSKYHGDMGNSRATINRWREAGIIRPEHVRRFFGKNYISQEGIAHVDALIKSGQFAQPLAGCTAEANDKSNASALAA
jgi:hypothetical protein